MEGFNENVDFISGSVYHTENEMLTGGIAMTSREALDAALRITGNKQAEAAAKIGWTPQQLNARLTRNTLRADEFLEIMNAIGVDVTFTVRETGEKINAHIRGVGRRVRAMVDRVVYDTEASDALANSFYADGLNEYRDGIAFELYIDREGRYFFAEYTCLDGVKDRITPITASDAAKFIERYGTDLHRKPNTEDNG